MPRHGSNSRSLLLVSGLRTLTSTVLDALDRQLLFLRRGLRRLLRRALARGTPTPRAPRPRAGRAAPLRAARRATTPTTPSVHALMMQVRARLKKLVPMQDAASAKMPPRRAAAAAAHAAWPRAHEQPGAIPRRYIAEEKESARACNSLCSRTRVCRRRQPSSEPLGPMRCSHVFQLLPSHYVEEGR